MDVAPRTREAKIEIKGDDRVGGKILQRVSNEIFGWYCAGVANCESHGKRDVR